MTDIRITVIVPVLNESSSACPALRALSPLRAAGHEVIVVDGGSSDDTIACCQPWADQVLSSDRGRARQMNAGAAQAAGDLLWFVHADTLVSPAAATALLQSAKQASEAGGSNSLWGRFDVRIVGTHRFLPVIAWCMNVRSRLTGVMTGDQGLFVARPLFERCSGFRDLPLMEDVEFCKRLRRVAAPLCLEHRLLTSGRRWEDKGVLKTILLMWSLRLAYVSGVSPERLVDWYYPQRRT